MLSYLDRVVVDGRLLLRRMSQPLEIQDGGESSVANIRAAMEHHDGPSIVTSAGGGSRNGLVEVPSGERATRSLCARQRRRSRVPRTC
jgi:hypothetical protein